MTGKHTINLETWPSEFKLLLASDSEKRLELIFRPNLGQDYTLFRISNKGRIYSVSRHLVTAVECYNDL